MSQKNHSSDAESELVTAIVLNLKSRGIFDQLRRECLSDVDTKPSFQNLLQRVEGYVSKFLSQQRWNQSLNKNQLRERLRKQINESGMLKYGIEHLVEQLVTNKMNSSFSPQIEAFVKEFLGIEVMPSIQTEPRISKDVKAAENVELMVKSIKEELKEMEKEDKSDSLHPMDIDSDSNNSNDKPLSIKREVNEVKDDVEQDNSYVDWPTPPKAEMLTPDRPELKYSPIEEKSPKLNSETIALSSITSKKENESINTTPDIKLNETFLITQTVVKEGNAIEISKVEEMDNKNDNDDRSEDLSDVSSVHTSDLSDFDDEISLDDSNDDEEKSKKKISLKVVKKITEVLSTELKEKDDSQDSKNSNTDKSKVKKDNKSETKRIRKVNPKYSSNEFSSIFSGKNRNQSSKDVSEDECETSKNSPSVEKSGSAKDTEMGSSEHKFNFRKRQLSNASDVDSIGSKFGKKLDEINSETSRDSPLSETTQDSTTSQSKCHRRKGSKSRNESQIQQRYDASDLYKPRPVISSRRTRTPATPDSSVAPNEDFVIHDLSK